MNEQQRAVVQQALEAHQALREWILSVPSETVLPAMPGINGDWLDGVEAALRQLLEQPEPVPLTDEQADLLINGRGDEGDDDYVEPTGDGFGLTDEDLVKLIRRVEAYHGIGVKP